MWEVPGYKYGSILIPPPIRPPPSSPLSLSPLPSEKPLKQKQLETDNMPGGAAGTGSGIATSSTVWEIAMASVRLLSTSLLDDISELISYFFRLRLVCGLWRYSVRVSLSAITHRYYLL